MGVTHVRATLPDRTGEVLEHHDTLVQYITDVVAMKTGKTSSNSCRRLVHELVSYVETKVMWSDNPQVFRVTRDQMSAFVDVALDKHSRAMMEPGEAVGAIGARVEGGRLGWSRSRSRSRRRRLSRSKIHVKYNGARKYRNME